jgi:hypothetical protein
MYYFNDSINYVFKFRLFFEEIIWQSCVDSADFYWGRLPREPKLVRRGQVGLALFEIYSTVKTA